MKMRDGGIAKLCALENINERGRMPVEMLVTKSTEYYSYRTVGVTRRYAALGANREFDLVVRLWNCLELPDGVSYAVLEDGKQYRIDFTQQIVDEHAKDITLVRLENYYDVTDET